MEIPFPSVVAILEILDKIIGNTAMLFAQEFFILCNSYLILTSFN